MNTTSTGIHAVSKHLNRYLPHPALTSCITLPQSSNSIHHLHDLTSRPNKLVDLNRNTSHKEILVDGIYVIHHFFHLLIHSHRYPKSGEGADYQIPIQRPEFVTDSLSNNTDSSSNNDSAWTLKSYLYVCYVTYIFEVARQILIYLVPL